MILVKDTSSRKYRLYAATAAARCYTVSRTSISSAIRQKHKNITIVMGNFKWRLPFAVKRNLIRIGCRFFHNENAKIIRAWALGEKNEIPAGKHRVSVPGFAGVRIHRGNV